MMKQFTYFSSNKGLSPAVADKVREMKRVRKLRPVKLQSPRAKFQRSKTVAHVYDPEYRDWFKRMEKLFKAENMEIVVPEGVDGPGDKPSVSADSRESSEEDAAEEDAAEEDAAEEDAADGGNTSPDNVRPGNFTSGSDRVIKNPVSPPTKSPALLYFHGEVTDETLDNIEAKIRETADVSVERFSTNSNSVSEWPINVDNYGAIVTDDGELAGLAARRANPVTYLSDSPEALARLYPSDVTFETPDQETRKQVVDLLNAGQGD